MPGSVFKLHCPDCRATFDVHTGSSFCPDHGEEWSYEQLVCTRCGSLISMRTPHCCGTEDRVCGECGGDLVPWRGTTWFNRDGSGMILSEDIEGPCPRCGAPLGQVAPDGTITIGVWD